MGNDVFRAIDAVLVLGVDDSGAPKEKEVTEGLVTQYDLSNAIGRLRNVTIQVTSDVKPFFEIGRRYPTHLRPGVIHVSGTAERAHVNGALLRLLLGGGADSPPTESSFPQPSFNIIATLKDSSRPDQQSKVTVFGAKFERWDYSIPTDDFVLEEIAFQALRVTVEES